MSELMIGDRSMPEPRSILAVLKGQLNDNVLAERKRRGTVTAPEDTFEMHRALARVEELTGEYARAFQAVQREARSIAEEELAEAFGDQDGIPNSGAIVPDSDGTEVKVSLQFANAWTADVDALMSAAVYHVMTTFADEVASLTECEGEPETEAAQNELASLLMAAMQVLVGTGKFDPQVTKVRSLIKELAGSTEGDSVAATVSATLRKTQQYKGIKIERVYPREK